MSKLVVCKGVANIFPAKLDLTAINQPQLATQLLLNQPVEVLESHPDFSRIMMHDTYTGWIKSSDLCEAPACMDLTSYIVTALFATVYSEADSHSDILMRVSMGTIIRSSSLRGRAQTGTMLLTVLPDGRKGYVSKSLCHRRDELFASEAVIAPLSIASKIVAQAKKLVGTPYLWGGTTAAGIDCSGLVQLAFRMHGFNLLRNASMQIEDARFAQHADIDFEHGAFQAGDLLFFTGSTSNKISHVGIALGDERFIHASPYSGESSVVIEKRMGSRFAHRFATACRLRCG